MNVFSLATLVRNSANRILSGPFKKDDSAQFKWQNTIAHRGGSCICREGCALDDWNLGNNEKCQLTMKAICCVWQHFCSATQQPNDKTKFSNDIAGYGNPVTITKSGKVFAVIYGFFGIPLGGILLASTSDYLGNYLLTVYNNQRKEHNEKIAITVASAVFLIPGLLLFIFIPAAIFAVIEQWSYLDAFFYSFVTLTTIGFGDVVAGLWCFITSFTRIYWSYSKCCSFL